MKSNKPFVLVLGITQDGGYPHAGCNKNCCKPAWKNPSFKKHVSSLAIADPLSNELWIIDATPDFPEQLHMLYKILPGTELKGILLTHGHIGHYTGLINLGNEVMNTKQLPVYAAQKMTNFITNNLPWKQLIKQKNIKIKRLESSTAFKLNNRIKVIPFTVPHRDEFTETIGFRIEGPDKSVVYIPDIDSWDKWEQNIKEVIKESSCIYLDGTFYDKKEIPGRNLLNIPHPFIIYTCKLLDNLPGKEKEKVHFIHLNHTNPALKENSEERKKIEYSGFKIAVENDRFYI